VKVAWVSYYNTSDITDYGRRSYYASQALKNESILVDHINSLYIPKILKVYRRLFELKNTLLHDNQFIKPSNRRWYCRQRAPFIVKNYAHQISRQLSKLNNIDIVCSGISPISQPIAYLECEQPIVIWTDSTFASALDFYPGYFRNELCQESIRNGIANERAALERCKLAIYWSGFGAKSAIENYQLDPSKVKIVPVGPNFEYKQNLEDVKAMVDSRALDKCKLLFLGQDWFRKGGDTAYQVAKELNKSGLPTELIVVGCHPILDEPLPHFVRPLGFISNATKEGFSKLCKLFAESHFLIMPSRADHFPQVFSEASIFGVPSIATNVGGISEAVRNDLNGRTFSTDASIEEYCTYISNLFSNYSQYKNLALSSFHEYESRLNWSVAGRTVKKLLMELIP
jgi:glycosyltransferase involved in cell wall biosynthesis